MKCFHSKLINAGISKKEYQYAQDVWAHFNCQKFEDYHSLYLKIDVLLLADIWTSFRGTCMNTYKIDPTYYYTAPGMSWSAMMKMTGIELELIHDVDMHLMLESMIRGGISMITKRHAEVAPEQLALHPEERTDSIVYWDSTNLYGNSMCQQLPYKDFEWIDIPDLTEWVAANINSWDDREIDFNDFEEEDTTGYILECDIEYPRHLHKLHNEYPLLPENVIPQLEDLNDWQIEIDHNGNPIIPKQAKLCPNLKDKSHYVIHYKNLKYALAQGLILKKVHRAISFTQRPYMRQYIMTNTALRKKSKSEFEKAFFKLMNNSVFGKTMENIRSRIDFTLVTSEPNDRTKRRCKKWVPFSENLVGIHKYKTSVKLNKPLYCGASILDLSKLHMQKFHYDVVKASLGDKAELCFTDTDSLAYHIRGANAYEFMHANKAEFNMGENVDRASKYYNTENDGILGVFKIETSQAITEFVGLRPKCYCLKLEDGKDKAVCKGVKKSVAKAECKFDKYKEVLFSRAHEKFKISQMGFRSHLHEIYTEKLTKIGLSSFDNKRWISDDQIHTRSFGFDPIE